MATVSLKRVVQYCDRRLRTRRTKDYDGACNGLQVENHGRVTRIAAAVDASLATARLAIKQRCDLLLVHHGFFWGPSHPWTGKRYELIHCLLDNNLAVYSSHLPLDAHPSLGNNIRLCRALGLKGLRPFFFSHGQFIGLKARARLDRAELVSRLTRATGTQPVLVTGGPSLCRNIGVVTGGAGSELRKASADGLDTFVTGEGPHWTFAL